MPAAHRVLQRLYPPQQALRPGIQLGRAEAEHRHLHFHPAGSPAPQAFKRPLEHRHHLEDGGQIELRRFLLHPLEFSGRRNDKAVPARHALEDHEVAEIVDPLGAKPLHILGIVVQPVDEGEGAAAVSPAHLGRELKQVIPPCEARRLGDNLHRHLLRAGDALIEKGKGVPERAVCEPRKQGGGLAVEGNALLLRHVGQAGGGGFGRDPPGSRTAGTGMRMVAGSLCTSVVAEDKKSHGGAAPPAS